MKTNFILYVNDQRKSAAFYRSVLNIEPSLDVPGMTEFDLGNGAILGLMPNQGIKKLLGESIDDPEKNNGSSRCELYFTVENPQKDLDRACEAGAKLLMPVTQQNWGDEAGYVKDFDGHVIAFARTAEPES